MLEKFSDRSVMLSGAVLMIPPLLGAAFALWGVQGDAPWMAILIAWPILGASYAMVVTPAGRLLRRSARDRDRPALFAAQFALSHACWLATYPMAGWLGAVVGLPLTLIVHAAVTLLATMLAFRLWPAADPDIVEHVHADLPMSHPHLHHQGGPRHAHIFVIDNLHRRWPA